MSKEQNIVIIAGYQAMEPAQKNFDALVQLVKDKKVKTDGMILVQKDKDGKITSARRATTPAARARPGAAASACWWASSPRRCWSRWSRAPWLAA